MNKIVYLDTETTGTRPEHSTIQIGLCTPQDFFKTYLRHECFIVDPQAPAYNGIDLREAVNWPSEQRAADALVDWLHGQALVDYPLSESAHLIACGFNVRFDVDRVNEITRTWWGGVELFSHRCLDLTAVAIFHGWPSKSHELMAWAGCEPEGSRHDALAGATAAMRVHDRMSDLLLEDGPPRYLEPKAIDESGPVRNALMEYLSYKGDEVVFYRPNGEPICTSEMIRMLQEGDELAMKFLESVHASAVRSVILDKRDSGKNAG